MEMLFCCERKGAWIGLISEDGGYYFYHPEVYSAPTPPENPFNHPFWHRLSFAYEYW